MNAIKDYQWLDSNSKFIFVHSQYSAMIVYEILNWLWWNELKGKGFVVCY